jgi:hypothetical protein
MMKIKLSYKILCDIADEKTFFIGNIHHQAKKKFQWTSEIKPDH